MPFTLRQLNKTFGSFSYREDPKKRGAIIIDSRWTAGNIIGITTPFGTFSCHRLVAHQMRNFIDQGVDRGLINDIGGIWVPRHILWNPAKPLSGHAYGCDIDINVDDGLDGPRGVINYGNNSYQPYGLLKLARQWGFEWGGAWRTAKDGMHFSCIRIIPQGSHNSGLRYLPTLSTGSRGPDVKDLQARLNAKGFCLDVDGIFGPKTAAALARWQKKRGFTPTAHTDAHTWESLGRAA
ncbi:MAG: M15 family metallopeptidase [Candidatus Aquicultor sp.]